MTKLNNSAIKESIPSLLSWLALIILIATLCIQCPVKPDCPSINFDDGWIAALNYLPFSKYTPGFDYSYMYGPLWFLVHPINILHNQLWAQAFLIFEYFCLALVVWFYRHSQPAFIFCGFISLLLLSGFTIHGRYTIPSPDEYLPIIIVLMLLSMSLITQGRVLLFSSILTAILSSILLFIKFDVGVEVVITLGLYILVSFIWKRPYPSIALTALLSTFFISVFILMAVFFKEPSNCVNWVIASMEFKTSFTQGWSETTDIPLVSLLFNLGVITQIIYLWIIAYSARKVENLGLLGTVLFPIIVLNFLHGFVRNDCWHMLAFFRFESAAIALSILLCRRKLDFVWLILCFSLISIVNIGLDGKAPDDISVASSRLQSIQLSKDFLSKIEFGKTCDGVPSNMMWCMANHLNYKPNLFVMLCGACTSKLDKQEAEYFAGQNGPDYLFCDFSSLNQKHMFFETPESWRAILEHYKPINFELSKQVLLLKKQPSSTPVLLTPGTNLSIITGEWLSVPFCQNPMYCSFHFMYNFWGKIFSLFYKIPSIYFNVKYADGQMQSYRLVPDSSRNGILVNYLPEDMQALRLLFDGKANNSVIEFQLVGPGLSYFQTPISYNWLKQENKLIQLEKNKFIAGLLTPSNNRFKLRISSNPTRYTVDHIPIYGRKNNEPINFLFIATEQDSNFPVNALYIQVDSGPFIKTSARNPIYELAPFLSSRTSLTSGFKIALDTRELVSGRHFLNYVVQPVNSDKLYKMPDSLGFIIE